MRAVAGGCAVSVVAVVVLLLLCGSALKACAEGVRAWSWTVECSPNVAWRGSESSHAGICGTARDYTREQPKESERR
jgi:hypothetical protein